MEITGRERQAGCNDEAFLCMGKFSKKISEERDLIPEVPVICCDFVLVLNIYFPTLILRLQFIIFFLKRFPKLYKL